MKNIIQFVLILVSVFSATGEEEVLYARVGEDVVLKNPDSYNPGKHYMYWKLAKNEKTNIAWCNTFGTKKIEDDYLKFLTWTEGLLTIPKIQQEHFETYICQLTLNGQPTTTVTYKILQLSVTLKPQSLLLPGDSLSLDCSAPDKPQIQWLNSRKQRVGTHQGQLNVIVTSQDIGEWTCIVTNNKKEHHAKVPVSVMGLSPAPSRPQYTSKTSRLNIPCSIPSDISWEQIKALGIQEVEWQFIPKRSSGLISNDSQVLFSLSLEDPLTWKPHHHRELNVAPDPKKGNLSLTRKQGREDDRGLYMCIMKFKNGVSLNRTVHVEVLQILSSAGTNLTSGQHVNLTCSIGHPVPSDLQVKWSQPVQSSHPFLKSDHHPAHLIIQEVGTKHSGSWGCALWQGKTKLTSDVIKLKIEPRLSVWMLVIICSAAAIVILILILVFILCRRRQRKIRHLKHRICQCENPKPKGFYRT